MNPLDYYLRGPILKGKRFIIVAVETVQNQMIEQFPAFLRYSSDIDGYVFDPRAAGDLTPTIFELDDIFTSGQAIIKDVSPKFSDANQDLYLNMDDDNFAIRGPNKQAFTVSTFVNPWPQSPFLSGASYELVINLDKLLFHKYLPDSSTYNPAVCAPPTGIIDDPEFPSEVHRTFRLVPLEIYVQETCEVFCQPSTPSAQCVKNVRDLEVKWILRNLLLNLICPINDKYYTSPRDCRNNFFYQYCTVGRPCGSNNCNGTCSNKGEICGFNPQSQTFVCVPIDAFYQTSSFWILFGFVIVGILLIIILMFSGLNNGRS